MWPTSIFIVLRKTGLFRFLCVFLWSVISQHTRYNHPHLSKAFFSKYTDWSFSELSSSLTTFLENKETTFPVNMVNIQEDKSLVIRAKRFYTVLLL